MIERQEAASGRGDAGMSLTELIMVIAIGATVFALLAAVTVNVLRNDAVNLVRENQTAEIRKASVWLSEALTYATAPLADELKLSDKGAVQVAEPNKVSFTSALPLDSAGGKGALSLITIQLGEKCWSGEADPGTLHRCVQSPKELVAGTSTFCDYGALNCPAALFEDMPVARGVRQDEPIFTYHVQQGGAPNAQTGVITKPEHQVSADFGRILALELRVTVGSTVAGREVESTIYRYYHINEWSRI
ncbi:MAG: hypothetical protein LBD97_04875 [Bifidobacteriaceae bacterium]|jgi:hypothetical protein|nr:hypothetical protein [Bifidobacteriaceae bacterium]